MSFLPGSRNDNANLHPKSLTVEPKPVVTSQSFKTARYPKLKKSSSLSTEKLSKNPSVSPAKTARNSTRPQSVLDDEELRSVHGCSPCLVLLDRQAVRRHLDRLILHHECRTRQLSVSLDKLKHADDGEDHLEGAVNDEEG